MKKKIILMVAFLFVTFTISACRNGSDSIDIESEVSQIELVETEAGTEIVSETEVEVEIETEVEVETEIESEVEIETDVEIETEVESEVETDDDTEGVREVDEYGGWLEEEWEGGGYYCIGEYRFYVNYFDDLDYGLRDLFITLANAGDDTIVFLGRDEYNGRRYGIMHVCDVQYCMYGANRLNEFAESEGLEMQRDTPTSKGGGNYIGYKNGAEMYYDHIGSLYTQEELTQFYEDHPEYSPWHF